MFPLTNCCISLDFSCLFTWSIWSIWNAKDQTVHQRKNSLSLSFDRAKNRIVWCDFLDDKWAVNKPQHMGTKFQTGITHNTYLCLVLTHNLTYVTVYDARFFLLHCKFSIRISMESANIFN